MTKFIFQLTFLFTSFIGYATEPTIIFEDDKNKLFSVSFAEFKGQVEVNIFNWTGEAVYNDKLITDGFSIKTFDVTSLPDGNYVLIIADSMKERATPFVITKSAIDFKSNLTTMTYSPAIQQINNSVYINALTGKENAMVQIKVEDQDSNVIYQNDFKSDVTFGKILDFSQLDSGVFLVKVNINDKNYYKSIEIR